MSELKIQVRDHGPFLITGPATVTDAAGTSFDLKGKADSLPEASETMTTTAKSPPSVRKDVVSART